MRQRRTANSIVERGGDFSIQAKDNQNTVHGVAAKLTEAIAADCDKAPRMILRRF